MHTAYKFHRGIVTNTSKYNYGEGLDLKISIKAPFS